MRSVLLPVAPLWWRAVAATRALLRGGGILGLCTVALLWLGVFHHLADEHEQAKRAATQSTANLARAFEEHIIRSIKAIDQAIFYIRDSYTKDPEHFDLSLWSQNRQFLTDFTVQISIIDKNGMLAANNLGFAKGSLDLSDREHFRVHADGTRDELFISKPVFGRASGKWSIQLTRRINAPGGSFDGVIVVSLDPYYLARYYESIDVGVRGAVLLVGLDGIVRARGALLDRTIGQLRNDSAMFKALETRKQGSYVSASRTDGVERIHSYREVSGYPLVVVVGFATDEVFATYRENRRSYLLAAAGLTLLLLLVTALIVRHQAGLQRAREALHASEAEQVRKSELLERTLENMSQGIMMVDRERRVQVYNRRAIDLLDLPETLLARHPRFDELLQWQSEHGEFDGLTGDREEGLRNFILAGRISDEMQLYERKRPDGTVLEVRSIPLPDGAVVRTYTDVTLRREAEEALRRGRDEADRAARAKAEFLATMSHEIRSPMNGLLGIIELLRDTNLDPSQAHMVELVHGSASSLLGVLNDVLDFSKIEAGAMSTSPEPIELHELIRQVLEPMAVNAMKRGLALDNAIAADVPAIIKIDPLRLRQILINLLGNAIKFTAAGRVALEVDRTAFADGRPALRFVVRDTGVGMTPEVVARLFEPFRQADASVTRNFGGSGLGLSISRRLAHLLDGDLAVESRFGEGSTFTLILPLIVAEMPKLEDATPSGAVVIEGLVGRTVLIAEDSATNRWLLQRQLERLGLAVDAVEDGFAALDAVHERDYDMLITDGHMPGMDGATLTRHIRRWEAQEHRQRLPILGLTADVTATMRERCQAEGMDDIESKPINLPRLEMALRRLLLAEAPTVDDAEQTPDRVFDPTTYRELFEPGDRDGAEWLEGFCDAAKSLCDNLVASVSPALDRDRLSAVAHRLAGTALSAGAERLGLLCRKIEAAAAVAPETTLAALVAQAREAFIEATAAVAVFLSNVTEPAS